MVCDRCKKDVSPIHIRDIGKGSLALCPSCNDVFNRQYKEFIRAFLKGVHND